MKTIDELRKIALTGLIAEKAHNDMGIYPKSISSVSNSYEKRNDYQEGWNDAIMAFTHKFVIYDNFIISLNNEQREALEELLFEEAIMLTERNDKVSVWICVNDVFVYGADGEDISIDVLPLLASIYRNFEWDGLIAWVAKQRGMEPIERKFKKTDKYLSVMECLKLDI